MHFFIKLKQISYPSLITIGSRTQKLAYNAVNQNRVTFRNLLKPKQMRWIYRMVGFGILDGDLLNALLVLYVEIAITDQFSL